MQCLYFCCSTSPSTPFITVHLLIGGHIVILMSSHPPPQPSSLTPLNPRLLLCLSLFWQGGIKTQPIRGRFGESNSDMTVSLIERKEEGRTAVSCVTMGLCLITVGWINRICLINGSMTTTSKMTILCVNESLRYVEVDGWLRQFLRCKY